MQPCSKDIICRYLDSSVFGMASPFIENMLREMYSLPASLCTVEVQTFPQDSCDREQQASVTVVLNLSSSREVETVVSCFVSVSIIS
jgi:hypothetical protein